MYKTILISAVVFIILFFIFNFQRKRLNEMFIDKASDAYSDTITSVFRTHLLRRPTSQEISKYRSLMATPNDLNKLMVELRKMKEYRDLQEGSKIATRQTSEKELFEGTSSPNIPLQTEDYDIIDVRVDQLKKDVKTKFYRRVIELYDVILNRMPTMRELNYYTARMATDDSLTRDQLQKILQSSREYQILKRNQSNQVYSELPMNATNAQIEYEVEEIYREIMGLPTSDETYDQDHNRPLDLADEKMMSPEMLEFLKYKYVSYELDKNKLKDLIKLIQELDKKNVFLDKIINVNIPRQQKSHGSSNNLTQKEAQEPRKIKNRKENNDTKKSQENKQKQSLSTESVFQPFVNRVKSIVHSNLNQQTETTEKSNETDYEDETDGSFNSSNEIEGFTDKRKKKKEKKRKNTKIERTNMKKKKKGVDVAEGFYDRNQNELSPEELRLRQEKKDLVKRRFDEIFNARFEKEPRVTGYFNKRIEEVKQEQRDDLFDLWNDRQNDLVRKVYEIKNPDHIQKPRSEGYHKQIFHDIDRSKFLSNQEPTIWQQETLNRNASSFNSKTKEPQQSFSTNASKEEKPTIFKKTKNPFSTRVEQTTETNTNTNTDTNLKENTTPKKIQKTKPESKPNKYLRQEPQAKIEIEDKEINIAPFMKTTTDKPKYYEHPLISDPSFFSNYYEYDTSFKPVYYKDLDQIKNTEIPPYLTESLIELKNGYNKDLHDKRKPPTYNICNVDPFEEIHKKTKEVYNKRRNGLAYLQNHRNQTELDDICKRQNRFLNDPTLIRSKF